MNEPKIEYGSPDTGMTILKPKFDLSFILEGKKIGRFWFDEDENRLKFEGDVDESAKIFIDATLSQFGDPRRVHRK